MATDNRFDVIVIGGGPAGATAAMRARELGASVALVERGLLGGTCTNDGCVPTRVLAKAARLMRDAHQFAEYGLEAPLPTVNFGQIVGRAQEVVYEVHEKKQLLAHLKALNIATWHRAGTSQFVDPQRIRLGDGQELMADKFILCVGGRARHLDLPGAEYAMLPSDVWKLDRLPASVAIVGSGATGCQLASIFHTFGVRVSLLDIAPRLLPPEDALVAEIVTAEFKARGIEVLTGIQGLARIEQGDDELTLFFNADGREQARSVAQVILSVGWPGNVDALNLPAAGVAVNRGYIQVDDTLRTTAPHIYAAGDITGRMMLVQTASDQGRIAAENAVLGIDKIDTMDVIPHGGFTDPEYASVGLTEAQAHERCECVVAVVPYTDLDRAVIDGHPVGACKLIVNRETHQVVGAHVAGEQAVEVVQIVTAAMAGGMRIEQIADIEFAYPTFAAIIGLAARQLARELNAVPIAAHWRALSRRRIAEWERGDGFSRD
ncbi:MAG: NAD(P)/FAD-dependent oxidoreductase [Anaerolineae bacterium]|nr:NAD(P)/FAD-dependent oxidoreductase [Anaerolineae bacterium]